MKLASVLKSFFNFSFEVFFQKLRLLQNVLGRWVIMSKLKCCVGENTSIHLLAIPTYPWGLWGKVQSKRGSWVSMWLWCHSEVARFVIVVPVQRQKTKPALKVCIWQPTQRCCTDKIFSENMHHRSHCILWRWTFVEKREKCSVSPLQAAGGRTVTSMDEQAWPANFPPISEDTDQKDVSDHNQKWECKNTLYYYTTNTIIL